MKKRSSKRKVVYLGILFSLILIFSIASNGIAQDDMNQSLEDTNFLDDDRIRGTIYIEEDEYQAADNREFAARAPDPSVVRYLGGGYSLLYNKPTRSCLENISAQSIEGHSLYEGNYEEVGNKYELAKMLDYDFDAKASLSIWGLGGSGGASKSVIEKTHFSSNKITVIGRYHYYHKTAYLDKATLTPEAKILFDTNKIKFSKDYGDGYVDETMVGDMLYVVFQVEIKEHKKHTRKNYSIAASVAFKSIFSGGVSQNEIDEANEVLKTTNITSSVYATGGFMPGPVTTRDEFLVVVNGFKDFVQEKITGQNTVPFSIYGSVFKPYENLLNLNYKDILNPFYLKKMAWQKLYSKIETVFYDSTNSLALHKKCAAAMKEIQDIEIKKCINLDLTAAYPTGNEYLDIIEEWYYAISVPVYRVFTPLINKPDRFDFVYYFAANDSNDLANKIDQLKLRTGLPYKLDSIKTRILKYYIEGSIPIYQLQGWRDTTQPHSEWLYLTVSKVEKDKKIINDGYKIFDEGQIFGYVMKESVNIKSQQRITFKSTNRSELPTSRQNDSKDLNLSYYITRMYILTCSPPTSTNLVSPHGMPVSAKPLEVFGYGFMSK